MRDALIVIATSLVAWGLYSAVAYWHHRRVRRARREFEDKIDQLAIRHNAVKNKIQDRLFEGVSLKGLKREGP